MAKTPTKQEVFDALLKEYRDVSESAIYELSTDFKTSFKNLAQEIKDWEELYRRAK